MEIILIRHGRPTAAINPILSSSEFVKWIRNYNASDVAENSRPKQKSINFQSAYVISSDLKRAIHSTKIYTGKAPQETIKLYREMEIPRYKLPFKLKAWTWVYLNRVLWVLGLKGPFESFKQAKQRAKMAAESLIQLSQKNQQIILFSHGLLNRYIRKVLIKKGWNLKAKSSDFGGVTQLQK